MGKKKTRYFIVIAVFIVAVWMIEAVVDHAIAYPGVSFPAVPILHVPWPALAARLFFTAILATGAYLFLRNRDQYITLQEKSARQEERYKLITEHSNDVLWTMDLSGLITSMSPSVYRLSGYSAEEVLSRPFEETLAPGSVKIATGLFSHFREIMKTEPGKIPSVVTELEHTTKGGGNRLG